MSYIHEVQWLDVCSFDNGSGLKLLVQATGEATTSNWSDVRLAPRFYADTPPGGLLEFDFRGHAPTGRVVDCSFKVAAHVVVACPPCVSGAKVYAATNSAVTQLMRATEEIAVFGVSKSLSTIAASASFTQLLAAYEDNFDTGGISPRRRLRHELAVCIDGPDERRIARCLEGIALSRQRAMVVAAYPQGGAALSDAVGPLIEWVHGNLGSAYSLRLDDRAKWIEVSDMA